MAQICFSSSFAFQSSFGPGNFEVVIPAPGGGMAHYWYGDHKWHDPVFFGQGNCSSVCVWEGDYKFHDNGNHSDFELLAIVDDKVEHWWRENDGAFAWKCGTADLGITPGMSACALCRTRFGNPDVLAHEIMYAIVGYPTGGLVLLERREDLSWMNVGMMHQETPASSDVNFTSEDIPDKVQGLGWEAGSIDGYNGKDDNGQHDLYYSLAAIATVLDDGTILFRKHRYYYPYNWTKPGVMNGPENDIFVRLQYFRPETVGTGATGRPCIIEGSVGRVGAFFLFKAAHPGHTEIFVPSINGGILHFWKTVDEDAAWNQAATIGWEKYDEVAVFEEEEENEGEIAGKFHIFCWRRGETWVHKFEQWNETDGIFLRGPETIGHRPAEKDPVPWIIQCVKTGSNINGRRAHIHAVGGTHGAEPFQKTKEWVIGEILAGSKQFILIGADGKTTNVIVDQQLDANKGVFHPFLTTISDGEKGNNLLSLPECGA